MFNRKIYLEDWIQNKHHILLNRFEVLGIDIWFGKETIHSYCLQIWNVQVD